MEDALIKKIFHELSESVFSYHSFIVTIPKSRDKLVEIKFIRNPYYVFVIEKQKISYRTYYYTIEQPGKKYLSEKIPHNSPERCIERIHIWCANIYSKLKSNINSEISFSRFKKHIMDKINNDYNDLD